MPELATRQEMQKVQEKIAAKVIGTAAPLLILVLLILGTVVAFVPGQRMRLVPVSVAAGLLILVWRTARIGKIRLAAHQFITLICIAILTGMFLNGGVLALGYEASLIVIALAAWLYGPRASVAFAAAFVAVGGAFVCLDGFGLLHETPPLPPWLVWVGISSYYIMMLGATAIPNRMLHQALAESEERRTAAEEAYQREQQAFQALMAGKEALRKSEEEYRALIENIPVGLYRNTPGVEGRFLMANPAIVRMFGYDSAEEFMQVSLKDLYQDSERRGAFSETLLALGKARGEELRLKKRDGTPIWGAITAQAVRDSEGQIVHFDGFIEDITDRKQVEEALERRSHELAQAYELQRLVFDQAFQFVGLLDPGGVVRRANRTALTFAGVEEEAVLGKSFWETPWWRHDAAQQVRLREAVQRAAAGETVRFETTHLDANGGVHAVDFSIKPLLDAHGKITCLIPEGRDITDILRARTALRESEARYRTLYENAGDAIVILNRDTFLDCNEKALEVYGCTRDQLIGQTPYRFSPSIQPDGRDSREKALEKIAGALDGKAQLFEWAHVRHDGTLFDAEISLNAMRLNEDVRIQAIVRDITERKRAAEQLRAHFEDIERFSRMATGREHRIIELKHKINELFQAAGRALPYPATEKTFVEDGDPGSMAASAGAAENVSAALPHYELAEVLDLDIMQALLDSFCDAVGIAAAIIDLDGRVFVGSRWQRICTDFHRVNKGTCAMCVESDTLLATHLREGQRFSMYQCRNGLTDAASPIVIEGRHVANVFVGQFLLAPPDEGFFRAQCHEYGFDEGLYFDALRRVPIVSEDNLPAILGFLTSCSNLVAQMGMAYIRRKIPEDQFARQAQELQDVINELRLERRAAVSLAEDANEARVAAEQARESLRESENKLRTILEVSPLPIAWADSAGRIEFWNRKARELFGYAPEQIATVNDWFDRAYPDPRYRAEIVQRWDAAVTDALNSGGEIKTDEYEITCQDGTVRTVAIFGFVTNERIVVIFNDISERKRAEAHREELQSQLRQAQKMEAIGTLAGGIAHDFNNILGAILGHAQLLQLGAEQNEPPDAASLKEILNAAERARALVRQILTFSRRSNARKDPLRLDSIVNEALKLLRGALPAITEIKQDIDSRHGMVLADATHMHQVVMNLCTNAAQAMGEQGGVLTVGIHPVELAVADPRPPLGLPPGAYLELTVADTGCGIAPEHLEHIFEPFFTTKGQGEGTGLGLAVVHGIVQEHGGGIGVESEVGRGTKFRILLPLIKDAESSVFAEKKLTKLPRGHERILLVDDEEPLLLVTSKMLGSLGYEVVIRNRATAAYELIAGEREPFDLVITDLMMPQMTGIELGQRLTEAGVGVPMLLATGYSERITLENAKKSGFVDLLRKPLGIDDLALSVRRALDEKR